MGSCESVSRSSQQSRISLESCESVSRSSQQSHIRQKVSSSQMRERDCVPSNQRKSQLRCQSPSWCGHMSNVGYHIGQVKHHKVEKWHGVKVYICPGPNMASQKKRNSAISCHVKTRRGGVGSLPVNLWSYSWTCNR